MLAALPLAASLLAVLGDDDGDDLEEAFQRALMLQNPTIFWSEVSERDVHAVSQKLSAHFASTVPDWYVSRYAPEKFALTNLITNQGNWQQSVIFAHVLVDTMESFTLETKNLDELKAVIDSLKPYLGVLELVGLLNKTQSDYNRTSRSGAKTKFMGEMRPFPFWPKIKGKVKFFASTSQWDVAVPVFSDDNVGFTEENVRTRDLQTGKLEKEWRDWIVDSTTILSYNPEALELLQKQSDRIVLADEANFRTISWDADRILANEISVRDPWKTFMLRRRE